MFCYKACVVSIQGWLTLDKLDLNLDLKAHDLHLCAVAYKNTAMAMLLIYYEPLSNTRAPEMSIWDFTCQFQDIATFEIGIFGFQGPNNTKI